MAGLVALPVRAVRPRSALTSKISLFTFLFALCLLAYWYTTLIRLLESREMTDALMQLEEVLRASKVMTAEEADLFATYKSKVIRMFASGTLLGGSLLWAATWKLNRLARINISAGGAVAFGLWTSNKLTDMFLDLILAANGTKIQVELAKIMAARYQNDPWTMQRLNKHFYLERLYTDSNTDRLSLRFRYRNFFSDDGTLHQKADWNDSDVSYEDSDSKMTDVPNSKMVDVDSRQVPMHPGADAAEDLLDSIFGQLAPVEEMPQFKTPSSSARVLTRRHRRSHRRHRTHHNEAWSSLKDEQPQQV